TILLSELARMPQFEIAVVLFNDGPLAQEITRLGIAVTVFPEKEWNVVRIFRELRHYFERNQFDIVHAHKYKDMILAAPAARRAGVRHVIRTIHGLREPFTGIQGLKMTLYEFIERRIQARYVEALVAVSCEIHQRMEAEGITKRAIYIPNEIGRASCRRKETYREVGS